MKLVRFLVILGLIGAIAGCASDNLKAPCPDFGKYCPKTPINSWNYGR